MTSRKQTRPNRAIIVGAGALLVFVILVGADFYTGQAPTVRDIVGYAAISAVLSPLGAVAIASQGGLTRDERGPTRVPMFVVVVVMLAMLAVVVLAASGF
jgi:hypothetical protein